MLELKTKWFTNTLAKSSMLNKDYIVCANNLRLYIVGYGDITNSGKNTYNYQLKDDKGIILASGTNAYLDKLTTLIKGENPKTKEKKENNESMKTKKQKKDKDSLLITFDEAFDKACKQIEAYKNVAIKLGKYDTNDVIKLAMILINEANNNEKQRIMNNEKQANIDNLRRTLELAKKSGNEIAIKQIQIMLDAEASW